MKENYLGEQDASLYLLKIRAEGTSYTRHLVIPNTDFRRGNQQGLRRLSNRNTYKLRRWRVSGRVGFVDWGFCLFGLFFSPFILLLAQ